MTAAAGHPIDSPASQMLPRRGETVRRGVLRVGIVMFVGSLSVSVLGVGRAAADSVSPGPASAVGTQLMVTASGSTNVGLQVFANAYIAGSVNPTGTMSFRLFGPTDPTCSSSPVFTSTVGVSGTSVNSDRYWTNVAGTYRWQASYSGDSNNNPAGPSPCANVNAAVVVGKAYSNLSLSADQPSGGTIRASGVLSGFNPTGTVTFYLTPPGDMFCSSTPVFTSTVTAGAAGTYRSAPFTPTVSGQYKWQATYSGDINNLSLPYSSCLDPNAAVTVSVSPPFATLSYPVDGQANLDTSVPFSWRPVPQAQAYFLVVGSTPGGWDLAWSGTLPGSQTTYSVPALPAGQLYALLYTQINGTWSSAPIVGFTSTPTEAGLTSPISGQTAVNPGTTFTWTTVSGVQGYAVWVGTVYGGANLVNSGILPANQSWFTPATLPAGQTLYVLLLTERNGTWYGQAVTITTAGSHSTPLTVAASTSPPAIAP